MVFQACGALPVQGVVPAVSFCWNNLWRGAKEKLLTDGCLLTWPGQRSLSSAPCPRLLPPTPRSRRCNPCIVYGLHYNFLRFLAGFLLLHCEACYCPFAWLIYGCTWIPGLR